MLKAGLPPVWRDDASLLMLGSLPGDASLAASQYYAHPRNQFWILMSDMTGVDLVSLDYQSRLKTLQSAGIALWDVIAEAERPGSLDQKIANARANDLKELVKSLPRLRAIAFNGKKAASLGATALYGIDIELLALPSSSPAYTLGLEAKRRDWAVLAQYQRPLELRFSNAI